MRTGSFKLFVLSTNTDFLSGWQSKFSHGHPKEQSFLKNNLTHIGKSRKLFPKNGQLSRKLFPDFFKILTFWGVTQGIFRKLFPGEFHEYLPMIKYFFPKTGHDSEAFPETFSNISWVITRIYEISNFI